MMPLQPADFIKHHQFGVLSTFSLSHPGYPFGSLVPYLLAEDGSIHIYISALAEHTKNIAANNKVALTISDADNSTNPAAEARITCLADITLSQQQEALQKLYQMKFSHAEQVLQLPGFQFYQLNLTAIRLIGGFGDIRWLSPDKLDLT
ncbi:HugZ family pyridoxamine 5'-phosphate oxidase [Methylophaga thiooxydans]|nr:pyridoxamine 5'-phosphate oxidase family protein [Methylophaga thiooxydans]